jgi:galactose mutarotase-like enzyme
MRFIAVHPVAFLEEQLAPLTKEQLPVGVTWHSTFIAYGDSKSYCHWEAPAKQVLTDLFVKYQIPVEVIHVVRHFDPLTAKLEPEAKVAVPV